MHADPVMPKVAEPPPLPTPAAMPELFVELGHITRQLHEALNQLGVMPKLQVAADGLPDARSRLTYIAMRTGEAANKVLNLVDLAKAEHTHIAEQTRKLGQALVADPVRAVASGAVLNFVDEVETRTSSIDQHLTGIMMAQDFHDLTGQVVARVVSLVSDLEDGLVKLLLKSAGSEAPVRTEMQPLSGPVVDPSNRVDIVNNQSEVDDLLASLGF
jgi:chemotaxis protein CheZ